MITKKKQKKQKTPRYKRLVRVWCWRLSRQWKLKDKIGRANDWCLRHPKRFMGLTVGFLLFCVLSSVLSLAIDYAASRRKAEQAPREQNSSLFSAAKGIGDPQLSRNISGLHELDANRDMIRQETKNLTDKGMQLKNELDSLLALPEKSSSDSARIVEDYKNLQEIVDFLNNKQ